MNRVVYVYINNEVIYGIYNSYNEALINHGNQHSKYIKEKQVHGNPTPNIREWEDIVCVFHIPTYCQSLYNGETLKVFTSKNEAIVDLILRCHQNNINPVEILNKMHYKDYYFETKEVTKGKKNNDNHVTPGDYKIIDTCPIVDFFN